MTGRYSLKDFFQDYMFEGDIMETNFSFEVHDYDPETGLFVAAGRNEIEGLTAILGQISHSERDNSVDVSYSQILSPNGPYTQDFEGAISKKKDDVNLHGTVVGPGVNERISLAVVPRGNFVGPDYLEKAMDLDLSNI